MKAIEEVFQVDKAIIGMVHLPPLPGSPSYRGDDVNDIIDKALRDARALRDGGVDGLLIENFWDMPYRKSSVEPSTIASMAVIAREVAMDTGLPVGINVLRNDALASLAIAKAVGGKFIRVNVYVEVIITDQGLIEPCAHQLQLAKKLYHADNIKIFADVNVKHGTPLAPRPIDEVAEEAATRGLADAVILTGHKTGEPPSIGDLAKVRERLPNTSLIIGSGCTSENVHELFKYADAAIVGSYFKEKGLASPVSKEKVERFMSKVKELRGKLRS